MLKRESMYLSFPTTFGHHTIVELAEATKPSLRSCSVAFDILKDLRPYLNSYLTKFYSKSSRYNPHICLPTSSL